MKTKLIMFAAMAAYTLAGFAQHTVTVKLSDVKDGNVIVRYVDFVKSTIARIDTVAVKDGTFYIDAKGDKAQWVQVFQPELGAFGFFVVPGEQGVLTGTFEHAEWSGSKFYTDFGKLEKQTDPLNEQLQALNDEARKKMQAGVSNDSIRAAIIPTFQAVAKKLSDTQMDFIKNNPSNDLSAALLIDVSDTETALGLLAPSVKTGKFSEIVAAMEATLERQKAQAAAAEKVAPGKLAPAFTLKTPEDKDLSLASLRGKYVILDFWGSWCGWCIKGFPDMKKYYEKYKSKMEILGVDCRDTQEKWKVAIEKYELPWKHVYNPDNSSLTADYAIEGYPTKVIIDPEGKIVKTIVGEDPEFYTFLDELFK